MNTYDATIIFATALTEEVVEGALEGVRKEIGRLGGEPATTEAMGKRAFGRIIKNQDEGRYYRLKFKLAPDQVDALTRRLKLTGDILRVQISRLDDTAPVAETAPAADTTPADEGGAPKEVSDGQP